MNSDSIKSQVIKELLLDNDINHIINDCLEMDVEELHVVKDRPQFIPKKDGKMTVTVTNNKMEVYADFYPPEGGGFIISKSDVCEILKQIIFLKH